MLDIGGLRKRAALIQAVRRFFLDSGYLEVDTPILLPSIAPEAHIEPVPADGFFLQTSPELCMKRLLAAGADKIFQITRCFRRNERGSRHLTEFTMLEWYRTAADYHDLMVDCENLLQFLAQAMGGGNCLTWGESRINLTTPWERLSVAEGFSRYAPMTVNAALAADMFEVMLVEYVEPRLGQGRPTFLYDYPAELGALARLKHDDSKIAERFELYIAGLELANGFSELVDPVEQRQRFAEERQRIQAAGRDPGPMPEKFLADLERMPPAAGIALGIDRLAMLFMNASTIDEVVTFVPEEF
ncbi:MAG: EF-P lysine aminoacylase GenX [Deltaproteobacteria bacterium RIFOXYD12_FULL_50_9]|nr:MAG: EF-P lysine aminoacylase GenX [Deltaproteobacteria bacterium RIFOXYD12_FULL_50_9]